MSPRSGFLAFALAVVAAFASAGAAEAGWVTFKNDTNKAIVVQQYITLPNGKKVTGKPYKLLPGESFREFQNTPGVKNFDVYDAANPITPVWSKPLDCSAEKQAFSVTTAQGKVLVRPAADPGKP